MAGAFLLGGAALFVGLAQLAALLIYLLFQVGVMLIQEMANNNRKKAARAELVGRVQFTAPNTPAPMMRDLPMLKGRWRPRESVVRRRQWRGLFR